MSIAALGWGISQTTGSGTRKAVLLALCNYANHDGESWPSVGRICRDTEFSERAVQNALRELVEAGIVSRVDREAENGAAKSALYLLPINAANAGGQGVQGGGQVMRGGAHLTAGGPPQDVHHHYVEPPLRTLKKPPLPSEETPNGVSVKRGSALPKDWTPQDAHYDKASAKGLDTEWVNDQADGMREWAWGNCNRPVARKADWDLTFHSWLRREIPKAVRANGSPNGFYGRPPVDLAAEAAAAYAEIERRKLKHAQCH